MEVRCVYIYIFTYLHIKSINQFIYLSQVVRAFWLAFLLPSPTQTCNHMRPRQTENHFCQVSGWTFPQKSWEHLPVLWGLKFKIQKVGQKWMEFLVDRNVYSTKHLAPTNHYLIEWTSGKYSWKSCDTRRVEQVGAGFYPSPE